MIDTAGEHLEANGCNGYDGDERCQTACYQLLYQHKS